MMCVRTKMSMIVGSVGLMVDADVKMSKILRDDGYIMRVGREMSKNMHVVGYRAHV